MPNRLPERDETAATSSPGHDLLHLGRQPILDRNKFVVAFELLFRNAPPANVADIQCNSSATSKVISNAFSEISMGQVLGNFIAFINVDEDMLFDDVLESLPKSKTVFEILETVKISNKVIDRCRHLKGLGYRLALDDVIELNASSAAILPLIDYIKIDILELSQPNLAILLKKIKQLNPNAAMLAEKVETQEQFEFCLKLGFDLFQGYFFARPQIISGKRISIPDLNILKLLGLVLADSDLALIEDNIKQNAALSFNLLKFSNSSAVSAARSISSIRESVTLLGRRQLQRWVQLLLYANSGGPDKLSPLQLLATTRGRCMSQLAQGKGEATFEDQAFLTGILSLIDALLGVPMEKIIEQIKLDDRIVLALLKREGELGTLLQLLEHFEQDNETAAHEKIAALPYITYQNLQDIHAEALLWANELCLDLN